jgi:hypothetical protein
MISQNEGDNDPLNKLTWSPDYHHVGIEISDEPVGVSLDGCKTWASSLLMCNIYSIGRCGRRARYQYEGRSKTPGVKCYLQCGVRLYLPNVREDVWGGMIRN